MQNFDERVFETLNGSLIEQCRVPGVENAFEENSYCMNLYGDMLDAYQRVVERLGEKDEDEDVEIIINNLLSICEYMCLKMFYYGKTLKNDKE